MHASHPKVSVIMPVFNGEHYICEAINSVLSQRMADLELIIVDDGSTDTTPEILSRYAKSDDRIRVFTSSNSGGPAVPKNIGITAARANYVCFLDHDDLYDPDRTEQLLFALDCHPEWVAVFHDLRLISHDGSCWPETYLSGPNFLGRAKNYLTALADDWFECNELLYIYQSLQMGAPHTQSILIAKNRLQPNTLVFDPQFIIGEDIDLWIRISLQGKMGFLNRPLSSYRQHDISITKNREKFLNNWLKMHTNNYDRINKLLDHNQLQQYQRKISAGFSDLGYFHYKNTSNIASRSAYRHALRWHITYEALIGYLKTHISGEALKTIKRLINRNER